LKLTTVKIQENGLEDAENKNQAFVNSLVSVAKAHIDVKKVLKIGAFNTEKNRPLKSLLKLKVKNHH